MRRTPFSRYTALAALAAAVLFFSACEAGFEDMNTDPTQASTITPDYLFSTIELAMTGSGYMQWRNNLIYPSAMMQQLTNTYYSGEKYTENQQWMTALWGTYYGQFGKYRAVVPTLQDLISTYQDDPAMVNKVAAARIMRVYAFHRLTDTYGDIPYFEAGKGYLEGIVQPKYTPQSEIYADMLKELEESVAAFDPARPMYTTADLLYGGDIAKWKKFGNSLMLRLGLRLIKVDPAAAQTWVQKAVAGGVMTSNDDNAVMAHQSGPSGQFDGLNVNPISSVFAGDAPMLAERFVEWMQDTGDPRLRVFAATYSAGANSAAAQLVTADPAEQVGFPVGNDATTIQNHPSWVPCLPANAPPVPCGFNVYAQPSRIIRDLTDPTFYLTYAQVALNLADAAARGLISGNAGTYYAEGVRAAMQQVEAYDGSGAATITDEEIDAYLAANAFDPANALEQINTQFWAASFLDGMEGWANWRRTGYPVLVPVNWPGNQSNGQIPRRMVYPDEEEQLNSANYNEVVARQGADVFQTRVWWDRP